MIKRKANIQDILLYAVSKDKLMLHECFEKDEEDNYWKWYYYQMPIKCDDIVCCCSGRGIGKTVILEAKHRHHAINFPNSSCLLATLDQTHILPRIEQIFMYFETCKPYKWFLKDKMSSKRRNLPARLSLRNGYNFHAAIAGKNTDADNLRQWHVYMTIIEEAQMWTDIAEKAAKKTRNPFNKKMGSSICWFGTNNGRVDTPFFDKNNSDPDYINHRYTIPSWLNPKYSLKTYIDDLREYGGNIEASLFKQEIRGLQGQSDIGVFNPLDYGDCCLQTNENYVYHRFRYDTEMLKRKEVRYWFKFDEHRDFIIKSEDVWFSIDAGGKGTPTEILIWALREKRWWLIANITLTDMDANLQSQFIDNAVGLYNPTYIAIDCTALELALVSNLKNVKLYDVSRRYNDRIVEIFFNSKIVVGYETDDKGNIIFDKYGISIPKYGNTFSFSLDLIKQKMRELFFVFPENDMNLKEEIIKYKRHGNTFRGKNHRIQAIQCFVICWWLKKNESVKVYNKQQITSSKIAKIRF